MYFQDKCGFLDFVLCTKEGFLGTLLRHRLIMRIITGVFHCFILLTGITYWAMAFHQGTTGEQGKERNDGDRRL